MNYLTHRFKTSILYNILVKEEPMPQLSLYIDEKTLQQLEIAAKIEHLSISKYAVKKLNESMHIKWPDHFDDLYGAVNDDTFSVEKNNSFNDDSAREDL